MSFVTAISSLGIKYAEQQRYRVNLCRFKSKIRIPMTTEISVELLLNKSTDSLYDQLRFRIVLNPSFRSKEIYLISLDVEDYLLFSKIATTALAASINNNNSIGCVNINSNNSIGCVNIKKECEFVDLILYSKAKHHKLIFGDDINLFLNKQILTPKTKQPKITEYMKISQHKKTKKDLIQKRFDLFGCTKQYKCRIIHKPFLFPLEDAKGLIVEFDTSHGMFRLFNDLIIAL